MQNSSHFITLATKYNDFTDSFKKSKWYIIKENLPKSYVIISSRCTATRPGVNKCFLKKHHLWLGYLTLHVISRR